MATTEVAPGIVIDDAVQAGKPLIKGTRVPVEVVVGHLAAGDSMATIRAALGYAARLLGDETVRAVG